MADAEQMKLHTIFRDSLLTVPRYQRSYAWDKKQVVDLLNDIEYLYEERKRNVSTNPFHYFGTIVLHERGSTEVDKTDTFSKFDIVDGQQRLTSITLLIQCVNEALNSIEDTPSKETEGRTAQDTASKNRQDYISYSGEQRLQLSTIDKQVYESLINNDSNVRASIPSQKKLIQTKQIIAEWLNKKQQEVDDYFDFLKELTGVVNSGFQVTMYTVEETNEAGRLFEVVNDRGKSLTILDKIKSYLIYCASRLDDEELSKKIHREVSNVIENITENGNETDLRVFVREHWRIFSGEIYFHRSGSHNITDLHRRIKKINKHASLDRDDKKLKNWIEKYLEHLKKASSSYREVMNPEIIGDAYSRKEYTPHLVKRLHGIHLCTQTTAVAALLMASHMTFGVSEELKEVIDLYEKFAFRAYHIAHERTDLQREQMRWVAYRVARAGQEEEMKNTFNMDDDDIDVYSGKKEAVIETRRAIEDAIGWYCPRSRFVDFLTRNDVFNGSDNDDKWNGFREKNTIRYFLYEYETYLRESGSQSSVSQLPAFADWKKQGIQIEHIWSQNPKEELTTDEANEHETYVNSLGNLALLGPEDNNSGSNRPYSEKREKLYPNQAMKMLDELPSASETEWRGNDIISRTQKLVDFAIERWSVSTRGHVHIGRFDVSDKERASLEITHAVRDDYMKRNGDFHLPHIEIASQPKPNEWETIESCSECDSTRTSVTEDGTDIQYSCSGCETKLTTPTYKVNIMQF